MYPKCATVCVILFLCFLLSSCKSNTPIERQKPVHPVRGQVFVGGKPAVGAFVLFIPALEAPDAPDPRPRATVKEDGSFVLSTYGEEDGAPAGDYLVTVTWSPNGSDDEDKLGSRYNDRAKTPLKVTVKEGSNELPAFKLK
jgi:hypothetical protein